MSRSIPIEALRRLFEDLEGYVVLRNPDVEANLARGGDIDLLVDDLAQAEAAVVRYLGAPLRVMRRSYVWGLYYEWGHIDLLPRMEWHGATYLDSDRVLASANPSATGLLRPRPAHEAVGSWFASLLWGGFFKARYKDDVVNAARADAAELRACLEACVGRRWGHRLFEAAQAGTPERSEEWVGSLRRALWWRALARHPRRTAVGWWRFWMAEVRLRIKPDVPWIAVLGPDGSGKSTALTQLRDSLSRYGLFNGVHVHHWRPSVLRSGASGEEGPVTDPQGKPARSVSGSACKLAFLLLDWWLGYWTHLVHRRAKGYLLFFDRYYVDLLVDPRRYRYGAPLWLARAVSALIPKPDLLVLLDAPADVLQARKQEVTHAETERQRMAYLDEIRRRPNGLVIDASQPIDAVVADLDAAVRSALAGLNAPASNLLASCE